MAESPKKSPEKNRSAQPDAPSSAPIAGVAFQKALNDYAAALQSVQQAAQISHQQAYNKYLQLTQQSLADVQIVQLEAQREYATKIQGIADPQNAVQQYQEASCHYTESLQNEQTSLQQRVEEIWSEYTEDCNQSAADTRCQYGDAYQDYLKALKKAWNDAGPQALSPVILAGISHGLLAVAQQASVME